MDLNKVVILMNYASESASMSQFKSLFVNDLKQNFSLNFGWVVFSFSAVASAGGAVLSAKVLIMFFTSYENCLFFPLLYLYQKWFPTAFLTNQLSLQECQKIKKLKFYESVYIFCNTNIWGEVTKVRSLPFNSLQVGFLERSLWEFL